MADFLPPVVLKLKGDVSDLLGALAEADAAVQTFARNAGRMNTSGFAQAGRSAASNFGRGFDDENDRHLNNTMKKSEKKAENFFKKILHFIGTLFPGGQRAMAVGITALIYGLAQLIAALGPVIGIFNILPGLIYAAAGALVTLKLAFKGVGTAISAGYTGDLKKYHEALAKLAPAAQVAVKALVALKPELSSLRRTVQENFWRPFANEIYSLVKLYVPPLRHALGGIALDLGNMVRSITDWLRTGDTVRAMTVMFENMRDTINNMVANALPNFLAGFTTLARFGLAILPRITQNWGALADKFAAWTAELGESGRLEKFVDDSIGALKILWQILVTLGSALSLLTKALNAAGGSGGGILVQMTEALVTFLKSAEGMNAVIGLFKLLNTVFGFVGQVFGTVLKLALPLVELITPLVNGLVEFFTVLLDIRTIGPAFTQIYEALRPLLQGLGEQLPALAAALQPLIAQLASSLGTVLADAIVRLTPSLLELIPVLTKMTIDLMPVLIPLIRLLADTFIFWGPALELVTLWAVKLFAVLMTPTPALKVLAATLQWLADIFDRFFPLLERSVRSGEFFAVLWGKIKDAVVGVKERIAEALRALPGLITSLARQAMHRLAYEIGYGIGIAVRIMATLPGLIIGFLKNLPAMLGGFFVSVWNMIVGLFHSGVSRTVDKASSLPGRIVDALKKIPAALKQVTVDALTWLEDAGKNLVLGLLKGIAKMYQNAINFIVGLGKDLVKGFNDAVGIKSPSRLFEQAGTHIIGGLLRAFDRHGGRAVAALTGMFTGVNLRIPEVHGPGGLPPGLALAGGIGRAPAPAVHIILVTKLDGKTVHRQLIPHAQRYERRNGTTGT